MHLYETIVIYNIIYTQKINKDHVLVYGASKTNVTRDIENPE